MKKLRNNKLLIFSLIFLGFPTILGLNLFYYISTAAFPYVVNCGDNLYCGYKVNPCNTDLYRSEISVDVLYNKVIFNQIESCYCFPPISDPEYFRIELDRSGNNITIKEIYDPKDNPISRCVCDFRITGEILIKPYGFYYLNFIFESRLFNQTQILGIFQIYPSLI